MSHTWIYSFFFIIHFCVSAENIWRSVGNHRAWKKLESIDCGFSSADRIIGGLNAALGQFPWITRLGYSIDGQNELDWMCGGALLTDRHVVTAAHCVASSADSQLTTIRMGEYDTRSNPDCQLHLCAPPAQDRKIKRIISHPKFNNPSFHNDIAVIILDYPVELNAWNIYWLRKACDRNSANDLKQIRYKPDVPKDYVMPICLPQEDQLSRELMLGELLTVAGWGKMNMTTEERAKILQYVNVPLLTSDSCNAFGKRFTLSNSELCAGAQQNKDACGGDSGGPLMKVFDTQDGPKSFLIGVVSFGPTICGIRKPGVYTSVKHFLNWILDTLV